MSDRRETLILKSYFAGREDRDPTYGKGNRDNKTV